MLLLIQLLLLSVVTACPGWTLPHKSGAARKSPSHSSRVEAPASTDQEEFYLAAHHYQSEPGADSWEAVLRALKVLIIHQAQGGLTTNQIVQKNPLLSTLGVKTLSSPPVTVWLFPQIAQNHYLLVQWAEKHAPIQIKKHRKHRRPAPSVTLTRVQSLAIPSAVQISEARVVDASGPSLILTGYRGTGNTMWLKAFKQTDAGWVIHKTVLSAIPPFLLTNLSGTIGFNKNDLVLSIQPSSRRSPDKEADASTSSGYKLAFRLIGDRYTMGGKSLQDSPYSAAYLFVKAIEQGHLDVARGWLINPKLISIPTYLGMCGKTPAVPYQLINLANPGAAGARFRLVTFERDDLILDIDRAKNGDWAVKDIFIAPSDPLLKKLSGHLSNDQNASDTQPGPACRNEH